MCPSPLSSSVESTSIAQSYETELRRVVDRLRSMPIARLQASQSIVEQLAMQMLESSRALGSPAPATIPALNGWAYGDLIKVLGSDLQADATTDADLLPALNALTAARQQLP